MNTKIRTYETQNNTYHLIRTCKTTYEYQQERKAKLKNMLMQKSIGLLALIFCLIISKLSNDPEINAFILLVFLPIGAMLLLIPKYILSL